MIDLEPPYRQARPEDAPVLAALVNMAGEGLPLHLWSRIAERGRSPWDVGRARALREEGGFSYRNAIVRGEEGRVVAGLVGYSLEDEPEPVDYSQVPPMFVPLQELEDLAPGTWYVNVLATFPDFRGRGIGGELLALAERIAIELGKRGMSIIVADANVGARRLYEKQGYIEKARRPIIKDGWDSPGAEWVLLEKNF